MWNRHDWALTAATAVGVCGMTLALAWTAPLNAGDEKPTTVAVAMPTYTVGNCKVTAAIVPGEQILGSTTEQVNSLGGPLQGATYLKPGALPTLQLVIANPTDAVAHATFHAELRRTSTRDLMRRVPGVSPPAWSDDYDLSLKPGEKQTITLALEKVTGEARDTLTLAVGEKPNGVLGNGPIQANRVAGGPNSGPGVAPMNPATSVRLVSMVVSPPPEKGQDSPLMTTAAK